MDPGELSASTPRKRVKPSVDQTSNVSATKHPKSAAKPSKKESTLSKGEKVLTKTKFHKAPASSEQDYESDDSGLENAYLAKSAPQSSKTPVDKDLSDADEEDQDPTTLVHESLSKSTKRRMKPKKTVAPLDETPELRDQRTIFVGNLPLDVASKKPLKKALQRHILVFAPSAKVESLRFRSIPFQIPTTKLPEDDESSSEKHKLKLRPTELRAHEKERASLWRTKLDNQDDENVKADEKKYLNPAQKKKIAFINQEFHTTADSVNAYIVFAHRPDATQRAANLPPLPPIMDPYEAAVTAAAKADGSVFMERSIRVDLIGKGKTTVPSGLEDCLLETDPRLSVFVGNLDFATKEEDLRAFFESVLSTELGQPKGNDSDEDGQGETSIPRPSTWVTRVRVVRDKDTQLGKGFAYVQFSDRDCVDRTLAMEESKLKFAKRKLRVQRCKTLPSSAKKSDASTKLSKTNSGTTLRRTPVIVPKGDPTLGAKLSGLSKEERKKAKSTDTERLARRLAKKKARMAMKPGVEQGSGKERKRLRSK
ncbi:hypothetical protein CPB83DRAFT_758389 [Crepidotus variabilis]|uniref:Nucleolar protein 12 n=1 Tax=Crepidotus variabilis TaxID=179855 RepID=A0A9P6JU51_9AGAR|nr:hypothetical protein CPB83DRAFT_758389 [Crepidotus variabilis]